MALVRFEAETRGIKTDKACPGSSHHGNGDFQRVALDRLDIFGKEWSRVWRFKPARRFLTSIAGANAIMDCSANPSGTSLSSESQQLVDWADDLKALGN